MKFQYPLEKLLELKLQEEKQLLANLAAQRQKLQLGRERLSKLEANYFGYLKTFAGNTKLPAAKLISYLRFLPILQAGIKQEKTECDLMDAEADNLLIELMELVKERKALEKLKEKKNQDFLLEAGKKEQLQLDELAVFRYYL